MRKNVRQSQLHVLEVHRLAEQRVEVVTHGEEGNGECTDDGNQKEDSCYGGNDRVGRVVVENVSLGAGSELQVSTHGGEKIQEENNTRRANGDAPHARRTTVLQFLVVARRIVMTIVRYADNGNHTNDSGTPLEDADRFVDVVVGDELLSDHNNYENHRKDGQDRDVFQRIDS